MTQTARDDAEGSRIPWRIIGWGGAAALLLFPLIAMQFSPDVQWSAGDFLFAAIMFAIVGGLAELTVRSSPNKYYRAGAAAAVFTSFLLIWINGAVGIIGDEGNPANLMFGAVILVAICGSIVAGFQAQRMAYAMVTAAAAETLVGIVVLAYGLGADEPPGLAGVLVLVNFFTLAWLLSAWLFWKASRTGA